MVCGHTHLRIYNGPESFAESPERETVDIRLADLIPLLADAILSRRTWLDDFADDEIKIPADLYQVVLAYQHHRRPVA